jgi:hypothetical protein
MKIRNMIQRVSSDNALRSTASRPRVGRDPMCETLEGRQLLSTAASTVASGMPTWGNSGSFPGGPGGPPTAAEIAHFGGKGGHRGVHGKGSANVAHRGHSGSFTPPTMSSALKADLTTLQNDQNQLQSELPSSVTAAVTADQAVISKAMSSLPRPDRNVNSMTPPSTSSTPSSADMTTMLEKAGISAAQATQIATDFQTYQTDLNSVDPTLQAKITADKTAITNDGGPTLPSGAGGMVFPGQPMNGKPSS